MGIYLRSLGSDFYEETADLLRPEETDNSEAPRPQRGPFEIFVGCDEDGRPKVAMGVSKDTWKSRRWVKVRDYDFWETMAALERPTEIASRSPEACGRWTKSRGRSCQPHSSAVCSHEFVRVLRDKISQCVSTSKSGPNWSEKTASQLMYVLKKAGIDKSFNLHFSRASFDRAIEGGYKLRRDHGVEALYSKCCYVFIDETDIQVLAPGVQSEETCSAKAPVELRCEDIPCLHTIAQEISLIMKEHTAPSAEYPLPKDQEQALDAADTDGCAQQCGQETASSSCRGTSDHQDTLEVCTDRDHRADEEDAGWRHDKLTEIISSFVGWSRHEDRFTGTNRETLHAARAEDASKISEIRGLKTQSYLDLLSTRRPELYVKFRVIPSKNGLSHYDAMTRLISE